MVALRYNKVIITADEANELVFADALKACYLRKGQRESSIQKQFNHFEEKTNERGDEAIVKSCKTSAKCTKCDQTRSTHLETVANHALIGGVGCSDTVKQRLQKMTGDETGRRLRRERLNDANAENVATNQAQVVH